MKMFPPSRRSACGMRLSIIKQSGNLLIDKVKIQAIAVQIPPNQSPINIKKIARMSRPVPFSCSTRTLVVAAVIWSFLNH